LVSMKRPRICAVIVGKDQEAIKKIEPLIELFEVRIDLIGDGWAELAKQLTKPWIACNRRADEGGRWEKDEDKRIDELLKATELGADMIDIELRTTNLAEIILLIKQRAKCLISFHDFKGTPPFDEMLEIVQRQLDTGADVCKLVTTAQSLEDNNTVLQLIPAFPAARVIALAMGHLGLTSRILCPLVGGYLTYASIEPGRESASGQITVTYLRKIYEMVTKC
jgi:3-dehydroquinate dehydratase-1